ncbi:MAG: NAD(P)-dependent oxidoreductase [Anaerolineae bacterium]|nr:NAD(P)-dependent oxidoreductase [Anaerolineae bacterium]
MIACLRRLVAKCDTISGYSPLTKPTCKRCFPVKKILITGAGGRVGRVVADGLRVTGQYEVLATDARPDPDHAIEALDVRDAESLASRFAGVDTVIHLAWYMRSDQFHEQIIPVNIAGTYHLYEAARLNRVRRVIFGSSNHATGFYRSDEPVMPDMPMRPDSLYGLGKCWGELVGRLYADKYDVSAINVRIGNFNAENQPGSLRATRIWISHRDIVQLMIRCIEADDDIRFLTLYGTSANTRSYYPIDYLADLIGYQPQDNGELYVEEILRANPQDLSDYEFQGGGMLKREDG